MLIQNEFLTVSRLSVCSPNMVSLQNLTQAHFYEGQNLFDVLSASSAHLPMM